MIPPFKKIRIEDPDIQRFQDNVAHALGPVLKNPLLDTILLKSVVLKSGQDNLVQHSLQRTPILWLPIGQNANAVIWEQPTTFESKFINLHTSADCTLNLLVG
jgi:hypothetical protein